MFAKSILLSVVLLAACAHPPVPTAVVPTNTPVAQSEVADPPEQVVQATRVFPNVELTDELLYQFLLAEIAAQRGEAGIAVDTSVVLADKTRDPRVAMRAAQLAVESGQMDKAVDAVRLWREIEPASPAANRMLASILLRTGRMNEAQVAFSDLLQNDQEGVGVTFVQAYQMLSGQPDKVAAVKWLSDLARPYPNVAEAHWAVAQLAEAAGNTKLALSEARTASSLRPEWDIAVSLEAALLRRESPQAGLDRLRAYLLQYPDEQEIRLQYARALLDQKQFKLSRDEFQHLANDNPDSPEMAFAIALISLQMEDFQGAEVQLKQALSKGKKDQDTVYYYLGQLNEAKKNPGEAIKNYNLVKAGEYLFSAQLRAAFLLGKRGEYAAATQHLRGVQVTSNQERAQLIVAESRILLEAKQPEQAYQVMQQGLEKLPNHPDLLYEAAMVAEKAGKPSEAEKLLRKLIQLKPNDAQAYNALGYTLLERNERVAEAIALVEKAMQLSPDDPAILDSMGWGYYRSGKLDESIKFLRRAFASNPDPEIAAHLGEVLWISGERGEARKIWQDSLKEHVDSEPLQSVIKKFLQ